MQQGKSDSTGEKSLEELEAEISSDLESKELESRAEEPVEGAQTIEPAPEVEPMPESVIPEPVMPEPIMMDPLAAAHSLAKENYDKYLRAAAELDTFKRRSQKERSDLLKYGGESMARDLLEVLDNLERAINVASTAAEGSAGTGNGATGSGVTGGEEFISGIKMIAEQYRQMFERHGVRGESGLGKPFDPNKQEALASVPTEDKPAGEVIEEFRKTYFFKDKLLRTGQVVVTAAKTNA